MRYGRERSDSAWEDECSSGEFCHATSDEALVEKTYASGNTLGSRMETSLNKSTWCSSRKIVPGPSQWLMQALQPHEDGYDILRATAKVQAQRPGTSLNNRRDDLRMALM